MTAQVFFPSHSSGDEIYCEITALVNTSVDGFNEEGQLEHSEHLQMDKSDVRDSKACMPAAV